jgi:hypothetical protein
MGAEGKLGASESAGYFISAADRDYVQSAMAIATKLDLLDS